MQLQPLAGQAVARAELGLRLAGRKVERELAGGRVSELAGIGSQGRPIEPDARGGQLGAGRVEGDGGRIGAAGQRRLGRQLAGKAGREVGQHCQIGQRERDRAGKRLGSIKAEAAARRQLGMAGRDPEIGQFQALAGEQAGAAAEARLAADQLTGARWQAGQILERAMQGHIERFGGGGEGQIGLQGGGTGQRLPVPSRQWRQIRRRQCELGSTGQLGRIELAAAGQLQMLASELELAEIDRPGFRRHGLEVEGQRPLGQRRAGEVQTVEPALCREPERRIGAVEPRQRLPIEGRRQLLQAQLALLQPVGGERQLAFGLGQRASGGGIELSGPRQLLTGQVAGQGQIGQAGSGVEREGLGVEVKLTLAPQLAAGSGQLELLHGQLLRSGLDRGQSQIQPLAEQRPGALREQAGGGPDTAADRQARLGLGLQRQIQLGAGQAGRRGGQTAGPGSERPGAGQA